MRILFMGTPDIAAKSLESLYEAGFNVVGVVTNPDRQAGRGMKLIYSPVKEYALEKNIPVYQPEKISKNDEFKDMVRSLDIDLVCVVAYGKILPKSFLEIPKLGCINVHGSLLPKYRGAAPIQWAVLNGDKVTGITTMYMDPGMDTGDMILKEEVEIGDDETTGELWERLTKVGADLLVKTVKLVEEGKAPREKQNDEEATLAPMLDKEMSKINWNEKSSYEIKNLVRGLNPFMGTYSFVDGKKYKIWKVSIIDNASGKEPGTIVVSSPKEGLMVATSDDKLISILEIQAENAKKMNIDDFLRGNKLDVGQIFE